MSFKTPPYRQIIDVDEFKSAYNASTVEEALSKAERSKSSSDYRSMPRCRFCESVRIRSKPSFGRKEIENRVDADFRCTNCGEHFSEPLPPLAEVGDR